MNEAYAAAWLSEMWAPCREESHEERAVKRALDAVKPVKSVSDSVRPPRHHGNTRKGPGDAANAPGPTPDAPEAPVKYARTARHRQQKSA